LKPDEIRKLTPISSASSRIPNLAARPRKDDPAEVYIGDTLGIVFKDEDDGDYNFSMASSTSIWLEPETRLIDLPCQAGRPPSPRNMH
jgi:hypothetical protein